ncbi:MAG: AAA family ATPase, partial [Candidatus Micrarchaeota archaeon]
MIRSIRLVNWRSHSDSLLEFRKGTNLLVGIMGAGKSSVLEGISFALFGTFPALERRKLKLETIVRLNEPHAKVILEFEWAGCAYRVERAIERTKKGTSSHAELFKDGRLIENGPVAVTSYVKSLTAVDYDLFTRAIYSEQNNIDHFLNLDPRKRKEEMDSLLGLDRFETARANAVTVIHRVGARREALASRFSEARLNELEGKERSAREDAARLGQELAALKENLQAKSSELAAADSAFLLMKAQKTRWDALSREELALSARAQALSKDLEGKVAEPSKLAELDRKLASLSAERGKCEGEMKTREQEASLITKELGSIDAKARAAADASARIVKAREELARVLGDADRESLPRAQKECEAALLSLESERRAIEREIADLSSGMERLAPGMSSCPLCLSPLTDGSIEHVRKEKESILAERKKRLSEISLAIPSKRNENEGLVLRIRNANTLDERLSSLETEVAAGGGLDSRKKTLEESLSGTAAARDTLREKAEALATESESLRAAIRDMRALAERKKE